MTFLHSSMASSCVVQLQKTGHVSSNSATEFSAKAKASELQRAIRKRYEMAVLDLIHGGAYRNAAGNGAIATFVANIRDNMARRAVYRQTLRELNELSNRDLADLGLNRGAIRSVAYEAAWGAK